MKTSSALIVIGLVILMTVGGRASAVDAGNALLGDRDFCRTSSFGSWRFGHLHAGIDLSTGGVTGAPVIAIDSCWVWRVSVRNEGYGKALYLRLSDGKIAVYGHLSGFVPEIEQAVEREQDLRGSYSVDIYNEPYAVTFRKGDTIGFSGGSGWGPPHLHFELRSGMYDHIKISPFPEYIECVDSRPPVIHAVKLIPVGLLSSINGDFVPAEAGNGGAGDTTAADTLRIGGDFGVMVSASDYTGCGRITSPVLYEARVDTDLVWGLNLSKFPFSKRSFVWSVYHFDDRGVKYVRLYNPYRLDFNGFDISRADTGFGGFAPGLHELEIRVADACGNSETRVIPFYYGSFPAFEKVSVRRSGTVAHAEIMVSPPAARAEVWYSMGGSPWTRADLEGEGAESGVESGEATRPGLRRVTFPAGAGAIEVKCSISGSYGFRREGLFRVPAEGWVPERTSGGAVGDAARNAPDSAPLADSEPDLKLRVTDRGVEISAHTALPPSELPVATVFEGMSMAKVPLQPVGSGIFRGYYAPGCAGDAVQARVVFAYGDEKRTELAGAPLVCLERASGAVLLTETFRLRIDVPRDMRPGVLLGYSEGEPVHYDGFTDSLGCLIFEPAGTYFGETAKVCLALREGAMTVKQGVFADRGERASFRARADSSGLVCFETDFLEKIVVLEDRERPQISDFEGRGRRDDGRYIFTARALDAGSGVDPETIRAFVDGEIAIAGYDPDEGLIECRTTKSLREGVHRFTLEVKDRMGNRTSSEYTLTLK